MTVTNHLHLHWTQAEAFRSKYEGDIFDKFLVRLVCTTIYSYMEMEFFFLLVFKKREVLVSRTFWGPPSLRRQVPEGLCFLHSDQLWGSWNTRATVPLLFYKGGGFSKQKTLTTDDFVVVVLTLLGKLGYFSESHVTWAWSLTPVSPELGKLGHKAYCECKG